MRIIGGSVAGSLAAIHLLRQGHSVEIFHWPQEKPCSGLLTEEAFSYLMKITNIKEAVEREIRKVYFGRLIRRRLYVLNRKKLDTILLEKAMEEGARIVNKKGREGDVGADGFNSGFAKRYGFPKHERPFLGAIKYSNKDLDVLIIKSRPWGFEWLLPRESGHEIGMYGEPKEVATRLNRGWKAWPIPSGLRKRIEQNGKYLIGDAAGTIKPLTGGGIFYTALAAKALAEGNYENHPIIKWMRMQQRIQRIAFRFWRFGEKLSWFSSFFHQDFVFPWLRPPESGEGPGFQNQQIPNRKGFP
jgi:digeranylgeranylglycerophospholipid reductase